MDLLSREGLEAMLGVEALGGVQVTVGSEVTQGHFEIVDELALPGADVLVGVPTLVVPSSVPGFTDGATVEVEGHGTFTVRFSQREQDGALRRVALQEA